MMVTLIGMGTGMPSTITGEGLAALENADLLIGAARLLESMGDSFTHNRAAATRPSEILEIIEQSGASAPCVIYSGDSGFYSGTRGLLTLLHENSVEAKVLAGISSVQYLAARLGRPWQDWTLASAHGVQCDTLAAVCTGKPTFFLTGGTLSASAICKELTAAGLGGLCVTVGENLSYENEAIVSGTAKELSEREFAPLCVLLAEAVFTARHRGAGIRDDEFIRGAVPMTKQEIRAAILAKLAVTSEDICWDVGAGTGSVSVELALGAKAVYAVEHSREACELISRNREKFGAWKLRVIQGKAP
ncbi:MAG: precorrin-6y C5,15-methyltransferase (decarboxylating) subunit CbiE, partial [Angelakisella sp.]